MVYWLQYSHPDAPVSVSVTVSPAPTVAAVTVGVTSTQS